MRGSVRSTFVAMSLASFGLSCEPVPPRLPAPAKPPAPANAPPATPNPAKNILPPNTDALLVSLKSKGHTVVVKKDGKGRVSELEYRESERSAMFVNSSPEPYVRAFMKAHGDQLGYGSLGEPVTDVAMSDESQGPATLVVPYPKAVGCNGLVVVFRYTTMMDKDGVVGMPLGWSLLCPTEPNGMQRIRAAREHTDTSSIVAERAITEALETEPVVKWLVANGYGRPSFVLREGGTLRVQLRDLGGPEKRSSMVLATELAEKVAALEGMPKLDRVLVGHPLGDGKPTKEISEVSFSHSRPPLDGACIDPKVSIGLRGWYDPNDRRPSVESVEVTCLREPKGPRPPADSARALPKSFATSAEYLAQCEWPSRRDAMSGLVVDRRGDVYSYDGVARAHGASVNELTQRLRHDKMFHGTLPASDVESLVSLIPKVAAEKMVPTRRLPDRAGEECVFFRAGTSKAALVVVPLDVTDARYHGRRQGEFTTAASKVLERAHTLQARGL